MRSETCPLTSDPWLRSWTCTSLLHDLRQLLFSFLIRKMEMQRALQARFRYTSKTFVCKTQLFRT